MKLISCVDALGCMIKILKWIYRFVKLLFKPFRIIQNNLFNYLLPNFNQIISGKIKINGIKPIFSQVTFFTGLGQIEIGGSCSFGYKLGGFHKGGSIEIQARYLNSQIKLGNRIATNNNIFICAANYIEIGDDTLIGQNVTLMDHEAHGISPLERHKIGKVGTIVIGNNCWIGNNVVILKNSKIGNNSIVAVGALVSGEFPDNVIIGGVPAKVIKEI
jgi:acetyltransferase-like isoleucine patch superfamily enzyme